ncbi:corticoliberin-like [Ornithorhynchus anatinus]|uniref:corticoliberin-like n=1 Tax=Ornithorhynchus anatinus TaxID=9258 RepID=UPI0010A87EF8|nr:corticoliberin-like [Ornithorhynchus anatinus]
MTMLALAAVSVSVLLLLPPASGSPLTLAWEASPVPVPVPAPSRRGWSDSSSPAGVRAGWGRERRPNALDLSFHLLRELLHRAREEQLARKAHGNRRRLQALG